ncbi:hypothetical protein GF373_15600 [bacterium]|nr:hypothetical protein [bacterium]
MKRMYSCFSPLFVLLTIHLTFCVSVAGTDYYLYYLGGQSNMDGYGYVKELPRKLNQPVEDVMIFHGNTGQDTQPVDGKGVWAELRPGHGVGFTSDGEKNTYSDRFGIELTFARRLRELHPGEPIALIKYSKGGTSIAVDAAGQFGCWDPDFEQGQGAGKGVNQYDHFLATVRHALSHKDIDRDGEADRLIPAGIVWMQGESDAAHGQAIAQEYRANVTRLMDLIRAAFRHDDLPVVIGRISDSGNDKKYGDNDGRVWNHGDIVRTAQALFVNNDPYAALVTSTDQYDYSDPWHYDTAGYIDFGRQCAAAVASIPRAAGVARANQLLFREDWKEIPAQIPVTQEHVVHPHLVLRRHGPDADAIKKSHHDNIPNDPYYVWSGNCRDGRWAVSLRLKEELMDLSNGSVRVRTKQSGEHFLYYIIEQADGTWLVSEEGIAESADWQVVEFDLRATGWRRLDISAIQAGQTAPRPDLTRIRSIGWTDLKVGESSGGCTRVDWIEVFGR